MKSPALSHAQASLPTDISYKCDHLVQLEKLKDFIEKSRNTTANLQIWKSSLELQYTCTNEFAI